MQGASDEQSTEIYRFPEFFDRLQTRGALDARGAVESETEIDGLVYHHRGVQVPGYDATFVWEPADDRPNATFSIEVGTVGPRTAWAVFDASMSWDIYLVLFDGGAVIAWMSDAEFDEEEADTFETKAGAIKSGRFSFGAFFQFGPDWVEREEWALESEAPALIQLGDGRLVTPQTEAEFYELDRAIPVELRPGDERSPPDYLGLVDVGLSVDS